MSLDQLFVDAKWALIRKLPEGLIPWASMLITIGVIGALAPLIMMYLTWIERKVIARMQNRFGPTRVGIYGLMQPLADGLKMLIKEDIVPRGADPLLHRLAPVLAVVPAILLFAVIPFGRNMAAVDLNVGLLYFLAVGSVGSYAIFMGGWASRSKFSVLGAMRSVAQLISYEVPSVLSVVGVMMVVGSLSLVDIVEAQAKGWFVFTPWGFVACLIFFLSGIAEVNRTPFDMPEAESELVAGFHTEYSGMKFALWYMGEFLEAFAVCALTVTLFLGGWQGPLIASWLLVFILAIVFATAKLLHPVIRALGVLLMGGLAIRFGSEPIPSWVWFLIKTYALVFVLVWLRGTFPRLRIDQLMGFAWKFLLPLALVNILAVGFWVLLPFPTGAILSVVLLVMSVGCLIRLNHPVALEPRTYILAD